MKTKFEFDGFENRLTVVPENDYERVLMREFLNLKPVGTKYVLRVPRNNDGKTLVVEKKQFITDKFIKNKKYSRVKIDGRMKFFVHRKKL